MRYRCMVMGLWVGLMASFSFSQDLDLTISLPSDTWTECEPVRIIAQLRNHSHQDVKLCCLMPSFLEARTHLIIKGRDTHLPLRNFVPIIPFHHPELILLSTGKSYSYTKYIPANTPGVYTLKAILDLTKNPNPGGEFFTGKLASNLLQYTIQAATGADKLVLAWARNKLELAREKSYFSKIDHCSYVHSAEILDLFPTSTYAGWVLLYTDNAFIGYRGVEYINKTEDILKYYDQSEEEMIKQEAQSHGNTVENYRKGWISPFPRAQNYLAYALPFISAHPDFIYIGSIYDKIGQAYIVLNQRKKALYYLEKALASQTRIYIEDAQYKNTYIKYINELVGELKRRLKKGSS